MSILNFVARVGALAFCDLPDIVSLATYRTDQPWTGIILATHQARVLIWINKLKRAGPALPVYFILFGT